MQGVVVLQTTSALLEHLSLEYFPLAELRTAQNHLLLFLEPR